MWCKLTIYSDSRFILSNIFFPTGKLSLLSSKLCPVSMRKSGLCCTCFLPVNRKFFHINMRLVLCNSVSSDQRRIPKVCPYTRFLRLWFHVSFIYEPLSFFLKLLYLLGDIDAQAKLLSPSDIEAQTVIIGGGVKVDDSLQGAAWAGLWRCPSTLLHHHTPVYQVHPEKWTAYPNDYHPNHRKWYQFNHCHGNINLNSNTHHVVFSLE